jgi:5-hydroxyisourate hydrolase
MAIVSSHTLDAVEGLHAAGVPVTLRRLGADGRSETVFSARTDAGGRLSETVDISPAHAQAQYELAFDLAAYFAGRPVPSPGQRIVGEVAMRFAMPDRDGRYHLPVIIAPNGISAWWSS